MYAMWKTAMLHRIVIALSVVSAQYVSYDNYQVYRLYVTSISQLKHLLLQRHNPALDFWSPLRPDQDCLDVMVAPVVQPMFQLILKFHKIRYDIIIYNLERLLQEERWKLSQKMQSPSTISFTEYNSFDEINRYLTALAERFPNTVSLKAIGLSHENRTLTVCQISSNRTAKKPVIFIDAGIHAREWIAPSMALYIINQLVENPQNNDLLDKVDWHILPLMNPDGYEYSRRTDRMWRKTRSRQGFCYGTDGNRNFDFHWGERHSSFLWCCSSYRGSSPFSETETVSVSKYLKKGNIKLYLSLHGYGNHILYPWGYTLEPPSNTKRLRRLAETVNSAIVGNNGAKYRIEPYGNTLYLPSGCSIDWAQGVAKIKLSYLIKLPGGGKYGFDPPTDHILSIVTETFHGIVAFGKYVKKKFGK